MMPDARLVEKVRDAVHQVLRNEEALTDYSERGALETCVDVAEATIDVVFDELGLKECDADLEQAWRNGWGSAMNALRACDNIATSAHGVAHPEARRVLSELVVGWITQIEGLTDNFVAAAEEVGFASRAHLERRLVEQGDTQ